MSDPAGSKDSREANGDAATPQPVMPTLQQHPPGTGPIPPPLQHSVRGRSDEITPPGGLPPLTPP